MTEPAWQRYVRHLCVNAWELDSRGTEQVVTRIQAIATAGDVTDSALADVLYDAGVSESAADLIAPSIRVAIVA